MSDLNAPIHIPSELNVPDATNENETIEPIRPKSSASEIKTKSADAEKQYPKHRLHKDGKSQSMQNFSAPLRKSVEVESKKETEIGPPEIILSPPSAKFRNSADRKSATSTRSLDHLTHQSEMRQASASNNDMKLSVNRTRANSMAHERDDDEFDELGPNGKTGSQLRIRSSIISLFGRMGKARRTSNISQSSVADVNGANGINGGNVGTESNNHGLPLRALPQIAATKILRAFSYVGKRSSVVVNFFLQTRKQKLLKCVCVLLFMSIKTFRRK